MKICWRDRHYKTYSRGWVAHFVKTELQVWPRWRLTSPICCIRKKEKEKKGRKCSLESKNLSYLSKLTEGTENSTLCVSVCEIAGLPVGLRHMMTGVPDPWQSTLRAGLKAEEDAIEGWLAWREQRADRNLTRRKRWRGTETGEWISEIDILLNLTRTLLSAKLEALNDRQ